MTPRARWSLPLVVAAGIAGTAVAVSGSADAASPLPPKTPEQLIAMIASSDVHALSGTVSQSARLGLPQLGSTVGPHGDPAALTGLLSGTSTLRVWADGPQRARVQLLGQLAETDVVRSGRDVWTYSSAKNEVTHLVLPEGGPAARKAGSAAGQDAGRVHDMAVTPDQLARRLVDAVEPITSVGVGDSAEVAGRAAYELEIRPRTVSSLLEQATISVDAQTGLPLRVRLQARGQAEPAFDVAYTALDLGAPPAERFDFRPPPGAKVEERGGPAGKSPGAKVGRSPRSGRHGLPGGLSPALLPQVVGTGWTSVVVVPAAAAPDSGSSPQLDQLLATATRPVAGGRLLHTALLNVLITDDGRWLVGAVTPDVLEAAASRRAS